MSDRTTTEAFDRYDRDHRFHAIVQSIVHDAMSHYMIRNPEANYREGSLLATNVAVTLLEKIFKEDAELRAQRELTDRYKKIIQYMIEFTQPIPIKIFPEEQK